MEIVDFEADEKFWKHFDRANDGLEVFWFFQEAGTPPPYRNSFKWGIALHPRVPSEEADLRDGTYFAVRRLMSGLLGISPVPRTWEFASARTTGGGALMSSFLFFTLRTSRDEVHRTLPSIIGVG